MRLFLVAWLLITGSASAQQHKIAKLVAAEYEAHHFNGTLLAMKDGKVVAQVSRGEANIQFAVPVATNTRFPIASVTKLFTTIMVLQLVEKGQISLGAKAADYLPDLPTDCQSITIKDLLTHCSGLKNEPLAAYQTKYSPAEFIKKFVIRNESKPDRSFNYNNVDYVVLTRLLEVIVKKPFAEQLQTAILRPLRMLDSGVINEARVTPHLAYGYHNYTFGAGSRRDTLRNDSPKYLSNYAGAGAMYATAADLSKLVRALREHALLSAKTTDAYLLKPQYATYVAYARGYPTLGFYYNDKTFATPTLERRGSIDGFNSLLITNKEFTQVVIILNNTDTGDLEQLGDKVYTLLK